jgi:hypothetical protein
MMAYCHWNPGQKSRALYLLGELGYRGLKPGKTKRILVKKCSILLPV